MVFPRGCLIELNRHRFIHSHYNRSIAVNGQRIPAQGKLVFDRPPRVTISAKRIALKGFGDPSHLIEVES